MTHAGRYSAVLVLPPDAGERVIVVRGASLRRFAKEVLPVLKTWISAPIASAAD